MWLVNTMHHHYLDKFIIVFIDDIFVYSDNESDHETQLRMELQIFRDNQLYVKFSKCEFWMKEVSFLGYIISKKAISVDPMKS